MGGPVRPRPGFIGRHGEVAVLGIGTVCPLYTYDAADDLPVVDLGGRRLTKKNQCFTNWSSYTISEPNYTPRIQQTIMNHIHS